MTTNKELISSVEEIAIEKDENSENMMGPKRRLAPDGGWGWLCVLGRFYIHFLIIGNRSAFGVIYIELIEYFQTNRTDTAWVGSLAASIALLSAPLSGWMTERYGCRITTITGSTVAAVGIFISWFSQSMLSLCLTYGILAGIGLGLMFIPSTVITFLYFDKRRGLASAIGSTGGGIGAMLLPFCYIKLFEVFGWRGTFWIIAGLVLNGVVCGAIFRPPEYIRRMKQRKGMSVQASDEESKQTERKGSKAKEVFSVVRNIRFLLFVLGTFFCNLGCVVPLVHLPDMALQRGVSKTGVAILLAIMGISGILVRIPVAWISDSPRVSRILIHACATLVCGVATFICPLLYSFKALAIYSAIQGGFNGILFSFLGVLVVDILGLKDTNKGIAFLTFFGGIPVFFSSPLAGWMYDRTNNYMASFFFSGTTFLISGLIILSVFLIGVFKKTKT